MCVQFHALLELAYLTYGDWTDFKNDFLNVFLCRSLDTYHENIRFRILQKGGDEREGEGKNGEEGIREKAKT